MKKARYFDHSKRRGDSGMTLIDMCIFLIVIGLLAVPLIKVYDDYRTLSASTLTDNDFGAINKAIDDYYYESGNYPCPAVATLPPTDPLYGVGQRDGAGNCILTAQPGGINIGSIPFVDLKIPPSLTLDGWKNRIGYIVSTGQTVAATFGVTPAVITVHTFISDTSNPDGTAGADKTAVHFVLLSAGPDGVGAYDNDGNLIAPCPTTGVIPREAENCNNDTIFVDATKDRSVAGGIHLNIYYDDKIQAYDSPPSRMWVQSAAPLPPSAPNPLGKPDPTDIVNPIVNFKIGINTATPFQDIEAAVPQGGMDVAGNILADNPLASGNNSVNSDIVCDGTTNNCFNPNMIGGNRADMDCNSGAANPGLVFGNGISGFGRQDAADPLPARALCQNSYLPSASTVCNAAHGKYAIGFQGGKITCSP